MIFSNKDLRRLILPLIVEQILAIGVGMIDTMMISQEGDAAISGVSLVDMVNHLLITVLAALATGGAVIVSQYIGHRDRDAANRAAGQLITVTTLISVSIAGLCLLLCQPLLSLLFGSIEADVMESAIVYFRISAYSYPFLAVYNACAALFRSMGNSKISMFVSAGMNIVNAIGNAWLIFGLGMGVAGADDLPVGVAAGQKDPVYRVSFRHRKRNFSAWPCACRFDHCGLRHRTDRGKCRCQQP